jgi:hypothetical protein
MKFRLVAAALVVAILSALYVLTYDERPRAPAAASTPSSDDKAFKSLSIN